MFWKFVYYLFIKLINLYFYVTKTDTRFWNLINEIETKYSDYYIIMPIQPIGDLLLICGNIVNLKKKFPGKYLLLVTKKNYELAKLYKSVDEFLIIDNASIRYLTFSKKISLNTKIEKGKVFFVNPDRLTKKQNNLRSAYLNLLLINNEKYSEERPYIKTEENNNNTILLSPLASSLNYRLIRKEFWLNLAMELEKKGYEVVFNAPNNYTQKFKCIFPSLTSILNNAQTFKAIITFRSGFTDVVALSGLKNLLVIYPPYFTHPKLGKIQKQAWLKTYYWNNDIPEAQNIINIFGVKVIVPESRAKELIFQENNEDELLREILENIDKND